MTTPTIHNAWTSDTVKNATITWTGGVPNRLLVIATMGEVSTATDPAVTALSVGGTPAHIIGAAQSQFATGPGCSVSLWYLADEELTGLGTSGALSLTDGSAASRFHVAWATYKDVDQAAPVDNSNGASFAATGGVITNTTLSAAAGDAIGVAVAMTVQNGDTDTWGDSWVEQLGGLAGSGTAINGTVADKSSAYTGPTVDFSTNSRNRVIRAAVINGTVTAPARSSRLMLMGCG